MSSSTGFITLVADAKTRIQEISQASLKEGLSRQDSFILIDVREEREYVGGSLPGAVHLSKGMLECKIEQLIPNKAANIVLFCGGGFRSALAADNLQKMGYSNVYSLIGGYSGYSDTK